MNGLRRRLLWLALGLLVLVGTAGVWFWRATIAPTPTAFARKEKMFSSSVFRVWNTLR